MRFPSQLAQLNSMTFYLLQMLLFLYFDRLSLFSITCPYSLSLTLSWPAGHICPAGHERVKRFKYPLIWIYLFCNFIWIKFREMWNVRLSIFHWEHSALKVNISRRMQFCCRLSFCLLSAGVATQTQKPQPSPTVVTPVTLPTTNNNNIKKFAFLSQETVPDYRPRDSVSYSLTKDIRSFYMLIARNKTLIWLYI